VADVAAALNQGVQSINNNRHHYREVGGRMSKLSGE
jgi:hypothetical protein